MRLFRRTCLSAGFPADPACTGVGVEGAASLDPKDRERSTSCLLTGDAPTPNLPLIPATNPGHKRGGSHRGMFVRTVVNRWRVKERYLCSQHCCIKWENSWGNMGKWKGGGAGVSGPCSHLLLLLIAGRSSSTRARSTVFNTVLTSKCTLSALKDRNKRIHQDTF